MQVEQVQQALAPHVPSIIAAMVTAFLMAFMYGGATFVWWYIKRRVAKNEALEDERGPALYKHEHDETCQEVEDEHLIKMDEIIGSLDNHMKESKLFRKEVKKSQEDGLKGIKDELDTVHRRIDDGNMIMVQHLEAELARKNA